MIVNLSKYKKAMQHLQRALVCMEGSFKTAPIAKGKGSMKKPTRKRVTKKAA